MQVVGVRELKNRLSEYLREVRGGEPVLVTDRGEAVAELRVPSTAWMNPNVPPALLALARRGTVVLGAPHNPAAYRELTSLLTDVEVRSLLEDTRTDR